VTTRHRTDANHTAVCALLRQLGYVVLDTSQSNIGFDALIARGGRLLAIEIKDGEKPMSKQALTTHEADVHRALLSAGVRVEIIRSEADCEVLGRVVQERTGYAG
jgi:hypothetical protein